MQDEIYAGLKNGIDRGATVDEAVQSLISAGYNPMEVREAAKLIETGASQFIVDNGSISHGQVSDVHEDSLGQLAKERTIQSQAMPMPNEYINDEKKKGGKGLVILAIVLSALIFIGGIGLLVYTYILKE